MAKAAGALADAALTVGGLAGAAGAVCVRLDVEDDVVGVSRIGHALDALELIETEGVSEPPRHHVVSAGGVAADTDAADFGPVPVEREAAAEHVHAADALADHGIVWRPNDEPLDGPGLKLAWLTPLLLNGGWLP